MNKVIQISGIEHQFIKQIFMQQSFKIQDKPAGVSPLHIELHSEQDMEEQVSSKLQAILKKALLLPKNNRVLIIGGRCGATAQLLAPFCNQIDVVEQEPFLDILNARLLRRQDINYRFNSEGVIGEQKNWTAPTENNCKFGVFSLSQFHQTENENGHYNLVLLQNVIVQEKINVIRQLMLVSHDVLVTMIVPGKIVHVGLFQLLSGIEKNILMVFYENQLHERLKYSRQITGRRQELVFWQIFVWKKKRGTEEGSQKDLQKVVELVEQQISSNKITHHNTTKTSGTDTYQTPELVEMYRVFHFDHEELLGIQNYPRVCAQKCIAVAQQKGVKGRALDLGCAVGRTSFELSEYFDDVIGIDISKAFIACAEQHLAKQYKKCQGKVKFAVGDACNLDKSLGKFNLIFGGNLIDRLYDPNAFINHISQFLQPNGILILASPYTWLEEYTPQQKWIGGVYNKEGKPVRTGEGLKELLIPFGLNEIKHNEDATFVIKQNQWVFQFTKANITYWQKS